MTCCQVLLVRQDAGVEADDDADVLAETLVPLGGKLRRHAEKTRINWITSNIAKIILCGSTTGTIESEISKK